MYTDDTEILTNNGWVKFSEYVNQPVFQVRLPYITGKFIEPINFYTNKYSGNIYISEFTKQLSNNNIIYVDQNNNICYNNILDISSGFIPSAVRHDGENKIDINIIRLWLSIYYAAEIIDSTQVKFTIHNSNVRENNNIVRALENLNIEYSWQELIDEEDLNIYYEIIFDIPNWYTGELDYEIICNSTIESKNNFINECIRWNNGYQIQLATAEDTDKFQVLATLSGYMHKVIDNNIIEISDINCINLAEYELAKEEVNDIDVYSIEVPYGFILIRYNNIVQVATSYSNTAKITIDKLNGLIYNKPRKKKRKKHKRRVYE